MANSLYRVTALMPSHLVGPLMELIEGEGKLVEVAPASDDEQVAHKPKRTARQYTRMFQRGGGKPTGVEFAVQCIEQSPGGKLTSAQLVKLFKANGRAPNSATPALSKAVSEGLLSRSDDGYYHKAEPTIAVLHKADAK